VVDNSWLIIFFSLFSLVCSVIPNCACCACAVKITPPKPLCSLVVALAKPLESSLSLSVFYSRLYSSSILAIVPPFLSLLTSPPPFRRVRTAYFPLSRVGHLRVTSTSLFSFYLSHLYCIITGLHPTIYI